MHTQISLKSKKDKKKKKEKKRKKEEDANPKRRSSFSEIEEEVMISYYLFCFGFCKFIYILLWRELRIV